jgi:hypothetical protein
MPKGSRTIQPIAQVTNQTAKGKRHAENESDGNDIVPIAERRKQQARDQRINSRGDQDNGKAAPKCARAMFRKSHDLMINGMEL